MKISKEIGNKRGIGVAACNISGIYTDQGKYHSAIKYSITHLQISKEIGYMRGIGSAYTNLGSIHIQINHFKEALKYFDKGHEIFIKSNDKINDISIFFERNNFSAKQKELVEKLFLESSENDFTILIEEA